VGLVVDKVALPRFFSKYIGESNENLKFVIKNHNFVLLSCKLVSMLQTA